MVYLAVDSGVLSQAEGRDLIGRAGARLTAPPTIERQTQ